MSDRFFLLRVLCLGAIPLLLAAHPLQKPPAPARSASLAPGANQPVAPQTTDQGSRGVAAIVNDAVISDYDLDQRMALFTATSGIHPTPDQMKRIREEVLRSLVDETLQVQEADKNKIKVLKEDIDKAMDNIAHQNNISLDQIERMLKGAGVSMETLRQQIATQVAWNKLVSDQLAPRVTISDQDVDAALVRLAEGAHKPQFHVAEIFIGVDSPDKEDKARDGAEQIAQQVNSGAPFASVARQFSQSPSAADGGDIGWVQQGQLSDVLDKAISSLKPGEIAGPIRSGSGFYILQLRERREPAGTPVPAAAAQQSGPPNGLVPLARVLLPLPAKVSDELKQRALQVGAALRERIHGCTNLAQVAKQLKGAVYMNLGSMKLAQLSPDLRNALANTQSGDVAAPFISSAGVEIIVRCDPKVEKVEAFQMPTRKEVEDRLFQDQMSMMARRYLRDLRRDAVVEYR